MLPIIINSDVEYEIALERTDAFFLAGPGTPESDEMKALIDAVEAYENIHYPMDDDVRYYD